MAVFTRELGTYAQRLATIANGDAVCTTFIPISTIPLADTTAGRRTPLDQHRSPNIPPHTERSADPAGPHYRRSARAGGYSRPPDQEPLEGPSFMTTTQDHASTTAPAPPAATAASVLARRRPPR